MAIGCGCFLVRPGKRAQPGDSRDSSPPTSSRGIVENTVDSTTPSSLSGAVLPAERAIGEDDKPAVNESATAGTADDSAAPPTRSSSSSTDQPTTSESAGGEDNHPEAGAEASRSDSLPASIEGLGKSEKNSPASPGIEDTGPHGNSSDATRESGPRAGSEVLTEVEEGEGAGLKPSTPRDNIDGTSARTEDDSSGEAGLIGDDDNGEQQLPDNASERSSTVGRNGQDAADPSGNSVLDALISDMTSAADAWASASAARSAGAGDQERATTKAEMAGCTAVVFLDAPLITPDLQLRPRVSRKRYQTRFAGPPRDSFHEAQPVPQESTEPEATASVADDIATSRRGSRSSSDVDSAAVVEPADSDETSDDVDELPSIGHGGDHGIVAVSEQHPAGLGDPSEALERFLAWMGDGDSSGCGQREVLLVCSGGKPPLSGEEGQENSFDDDASETSTTTRQDRGSGLGGGESAIRPSSDARRAETDDGDSVGGRMDAVAQATDVEVILREEGGAEEPATDGSEGHSSRVGEEKGRGHRPPWTIPQIILGGTVPIQTVPQQQGQKLASETESSPHQADGDEGPTDRMKAPSAAVEVRNNNNNDNNDDDNGTGRGSPTQRPAPPLAQLPPSEVLLQTRPAAPTGAGLSRVAVSFPPTAVPPAACVPTMGTEKRASHVTSEGPSAAGSGSANLSDFVRVLVGPVIGRVSPTAGIVLVEVDSVPAGATRRDGFAEMHASDGVGVRLTDTLTGQTRQMTGGTWTGGQPGEGPRIFEFEELTPGRRYVLTLSGVRQRDQVS